MFAKPATSPRHFLHHPRREGDRQATGNGAVSAAGGDCAAESFSHRSRDVAIRSRIHFSRYYMTPLMEKGMIEKTDPDSPKSPRQEYKLA